MCVCVCFFLGDDTMALGSLNEVTIARRPHYLPDVYIYIYVHMRSLS